MARQMNYRFINTAELQLDPRVQGVRRERRVQEMAMNWDPRAVGVITVSQREDGSVFVIDGQHRAAAAMERKVKVYDKDEAGNWNGKWEWKAEPITRLYAKIWEDLTLSEEAQMYILLNNTKVPQALDRIAVAAVGEDEIAMRVVETAEKYGWYLKKSPKIKSPQAFYRIAQMDEDGKVIDRVFFIITKAWTHSPDSTRSSIVEGLARVIKDHPHLDDERMARVLGKAKPSTLLSNIESLRGTYAARARVVAIGGLYDRGLSGTRKLGI